MMKLLLPASVLIALLAAGLVVSAPRADAAAPDWMRPAIDDGRKSLYTNMDTARQGSPVVFTGARCRGDGAFLLFYEHRWLWLAPVQLDVQVPSDWMSEPPPRSFPGGVADGLAIEYGEDLAGYFAAHGEIRCPDEPTRAAH